MEPSHLITLSQTYKMPYDSVKSLPAHVKKYSAKLQRQWMHVFNTVYNKTNDEGRAMRGANSILKKRFKGKERMINNTRDDYFLQLVDGWLGNLEG